MRFKILHLPSALLAVLLAVAGTVAVSAGPAHALGAGRACIFLAPKGAKGAGHVGWAFQEPPGDHWFFGATEGVAGEEGGPGAVTIPAGRPNGAWEATGTWAVARQTFKNARSGEHPAGYYTQYTCRGTTTSAVHAADLQAQANKGRGYTLWGNNCMNHAYDVLSVYGETMEVPNDPDWISNWAPALWVRNLVLAGGWDQLRSL